MTHHQVATHVDIFLRHHYPNVMRKVTLRSSPSDSQARPQWGTVSRDDPIFQIRDMVCGGFRAFDFLLDEAYMVAVSKDETSFSSSIRMNAGDLINLSANIRISHTKFFLCPKSLNVDRPGSKFLWSEYFPTTNSNVLGTCFLMKGVGRGGGIRVYEETMMYHVGLMDEPSKPAAEATIRWLFVPSNCTYIPGDVEEGWFATILMDVVSL